MVAILSLVFCFGAFRYWFPGQIDNKAELIFSKNNQSQNLSSNDLEIPQSLLDYIKEERSTKNTESDSLADIDLINNFEDFDKDFTSEAYKILADRFQIPEWDDGNPTLSDFTTPEGLKDIVTFWTYIFGVYTKDHYVFYNSENVGIVYSVLDFSEVGNLNNASVGSFKAQMVSEEKAHIQNMLKHVAECLSEKDIKYSNLTKEERRIAELLLNESENINTDEKSLLDNLAYRNGFSHRIEQAIKVSGQYMDEIHRIFKERGVPTELAVIPFVESAFNPTAYSRSGAAGIWQFIYDTGKRYLKIDDFVDERYDPILSAYAAATHLSKEYDFLKSWPLTINAYNTGPGRMKQAVGSLNTNNIATIVKKFKGSGYGFDSRNYFPEFLAALHVYNNKEYYFGEDMKLLPPLDIEYVAMPCSTNIKQLARLSGISTTILGNMNLSLQPDVLNGAKSLPAGYLLQVPSKAKQNILLAMQELYAEVKLATHHVVEKGESLKNIAVKYDIPVQELAVLNNMLPGQKVSRGQVLQLISDRDDRFNMTLNKDGESGLVVPDNINNPVF